MNQPVPIGDIVSALLRSWPVILFVCGLIFHAGATIHLIRSIEKQIADLYQKNDSILTEMRSRLYDVKSQPIYVPVDTCIACRAACEGLRNKEYSHLAEQLRTHGKALDRMSEQIGWIRAGGAGGRERDHAASSTG